MNERMHRTQILLEPEQHRTLVKLAHRERRSVSDLVREMIAEQLAHRSEQDFNSIARRSAALADVRRHRAEILQQRDGTPLSIDTVATIKNMREERDVDVIGNTAHDRR